MLVCIRHSSLCFTGTAPNKISSTICIISLATADSCFFFCLGVSAAGFNLAFLYVNHFSFSPYLTVLSQELTPVSAYLFKKNSVVHFLFSMHIAGVFCPVLAYYIHLCIFPFILFWYKKFPFYLHLLQIVDSAD